VAITVSAKPSITEVIMPIGAIIAIVIIGVIVAAVAVVAGIQFSRRRALRRLFDQLDIHPLTPEQRARYEGEWSATQERFVEDPAQATQAAATLVTAVARDRGFSADDSAKLLAELSVGYSREAEGYRRALETAARIPEASTEELRAAVIRYRAMFRELFGHPDGAPAIAAESASTTTTNPATASTSPTTVDATTKE
jgi:hypothetical protein